MFPKRKLVFLFLFITLFTCQGQDQESYLSKAAIINDLAFLDEILQEKSSYQGLNGYDYQADFKAFLRKADKEPISKYDFGLFLSQTIGKIGDRHAYIRGFSPRDAWYFPIAFAPIDDKVLVLSYKKDEKQYDFYDSEYPYLKSINKIPIEEILPQILPEEGSAPTQSYLTYAIRDLRDIEDIFRKMGMDLPKLLPIQLSNEQGSEKEFIIELVDGRNRERLWDEKFYRGIFRIEEEQYNEEAFIDRFFKIRNNVAYIQIPDMLEKKESPIFFEYLNGFMMCAKDSDALVIDVRDNGGGTRDLIQELAAYIIHPDSLYVVNAAKQRGKLPLKGRLKKGLYARHLFPKQKLDKREQRAVDKFMSSFKPMYQLDAEKYSDYYYYVLNGKKLTTNKYHFDKPVYILANERSFSAASVLVAVFKGLPNVKIVGVNTDGSSGNSIRFELPNSGLRGKISTMVSFQKDGKVLDGIGTAPDIKIERNLDQIFFKKDYQLDQVEELILSLPSKNSN